MDRNITFSTLENSLELIRNQISSKNLRLVEKDLELVAEIGKTLIEQNNVVEKSLGQLQHVIQDRSQEIEILNNQLETVRRAYDSRLRMYKQLEITVQDLEKVNHRLTSENSAGKNHIKGLMETIEGLELNCEELQGAINDLNLQLDKYKSSVNTTSKTVNCTKSNYEFDINRPNRTVSSDSEKSSDDSNSSKLLKNRNSTNLKQKKKVVNKQITQLSTQLQEIVALFSREQRRFSKLEEQLSTVVQQNQSLEEQLAQTHFKNEQVKSKELSAVEGIQQEPLSSTCLGRKDSSCTGDNMSCFKDEPKDNNSSTLKALKNRSRRHSSPSIHIQNGEQFNDYIQHLLKLYLIVECCFVFGVSLSIINTF